MGGAEINRHLVIPAHPHTDDRQAGIGRDFRQQGEVRRRILIDRGDAHHPSHGQLIFPLAFVDKGEGVSRGDTRFLVFLTCIDLNQHIRTAVKLVHGFGERPCQLFPVERLDHVEQRDRVIGLVGLQGADQPQLEIGPSLFHGGPLALCLLHAVLSEDAVPGGDDRLDVIHVEFLRHCRQGDVTRPTACLLCGLADFLTHLGKVLDNIFGGQIVFRHKTLMGHDGTSHSKAISMARHAARLRAGAAPSSRQAPFDMALLTDERAGDPVSIVSALPRLPVNRIAVIFRHYDKADRAALGLALARICRTNGFLFLVAGDPALAMRLKADGIHVPQWQVQVIRGLKKIHPGWIISAACHDAPALSRAARMGADCAFLSPVFATASHVGARPLGPLRAHAVAATARLPVLALGGINPQTVGKIKPGIFAGFGAIDGLSKD